MDKLIKKLNRIKLEEKQARFWELMRPSLVQWFGILIIRRRRKRPVYKHRTKRGYYK